MDDRRRVRMGMHHGDRRRWWWVVNMALTVLVGITYAQCQYVYHIYIVYLYTEVYHVP
jgi:hypothetical protein